MKNPLLQIFTLLTVTISSFGQGVSVRQPDRGAVAFITTYLNSDITVTTGFDAKQLTRMGDSAASTIMKIIGRQMVDKPKLERILDLVRAAFERPGVISNSSDRNPVATLVLLDQLRKNPSLDSAALSDIDATAQFVGAARKQ